MPGCLGCFGLALVASLVSIPAARAGGEREGKWIGEQFPPPDAVAAVFDNDVDRVAALEVVGDELHHLNISVIPITGGRVCDRYLEYMRSSSALAKKYCASKTSTQCRDFADKVRRRHFQDSAFHREVVDRFVPENAVAFVLDFERNRNRDRAKAQDPLGSSRAEWKIACWVFGSLLLGVALAAAWPRLSPGSRAVLKGIALGAVTVAIFIVGLAFAALAGIIGGNHRGDDER